MRRYLSVYIPVHPGKRTIKGMGHIIEEDKVGNAKVVRSVDIHVESSSFPNTKLNKNSRAKSKKVTN
jgi:hypothetical protein